MPTARLVLTFDFIWISSLKSQSFPHEKQTCERTGGLNIHSLPCFAMNINGPSFSLCTYSFSTLEQLLCYENVWRTSVSGEEKCIICQNFNCQKTIIFLKGGNQGQIKRLSPFTSLHILFPFPFSLL